MKKLIGGCLAALAVTAAVSVAPPAQAAYPSVIVSTVYWTGADCISVRYSEGYSTDVAMKCGRLLGADLPGCSRSVHRRRPDTTAQ